MLFHSKTVTRSLVLILLSILFISVVYADSVNPFADDRSLDLPENSTVSELASGSDTFFDSSRAKIKSDENTVVAVLSDLHTRKETYDNLVLAIKAINKIPGIKATAITGDLVYKIGSPAEYSLLAKALSNSSIPIWAVPGNHDIIYKDYYNPDRNAKNEKLRTTAPERKAKIERFRKLLRLKSARYTRQVGGHLLVFLPNDHLDKYCKLVTLSSATLNFLKKTLAENRDIPTIIFCHGPLLGSYHRKGGLPDLQATAQPAAKIRSILKKNPQVFLWVSGHIHMSPGSSNFAAKVNKVDKVTNIHTPPVKPDSVWVQVLKLSPEKAVVRTYNPKTKKYVKKFDRIFKHKVKKPVKPPVKDPVIQPPAPPEDSSDDDATEETTEEDSGNDEAVGEEDGEESDEDAMSEPETSPVDNQDAEETEGDEVESDDNKVDTGEAASPAAQNVQLIKDLIRVISDLLKGLWNGLLKILKV
ncbi:MAG: metallophosphoesterase [uncultured bacterium]|nr:MAG: metallophosphoesterase [uncultured bacterium]